MIHSPGAISCNKRLISNYPLEGGKNGPTDTTMCESVLKNLWDSETHVSLLPYALDLILMIRSPNTFLPYGRRSPAQLAGGVFV